jgi:DNA-binding protein H-NS
MASKKDVIIRDALASFGELPIHEQREVLLKFQALHQEKLTARRQELLEELDALGGPSTDATTPKPGALQAARYRSKKDPLRIWSGRGRMARWLVDEMKQTGLPKEAFRVK